MNNEIPKERSNHHIDDNRENHPTKDPQTQSPMPPVTSSTIDSPFGQGQVRKD